MTVHTTIPGSATLQQLQLDSVSKTFDGFKAINNLSLVVDKGELRAVIGPNGAGKTTMMDIITGKTRPDAGKVLWEQQLDLTKLDEADCAQLGIGRKFQKPTVFESHTVEDNLRLSLKGDRGVLASLFHKTTPAETRRVAELLEIGMLLAQDPQLLLVDEPAAGMTDAETMRTAELLRAIAGERAVIVVEHDMDFVRALDCKVTVLHQGSVLAEGSLETVSAMPEVIEVYLGR